MVKPKTDFTNIKCCECGEGDLHSGNAFRESNVRGYSTKNWLCKTCYNNIKTYCTGDIQKIRSMKNEFLKDRAEKKHGKFCSKCGTDFRLTKGFPQTSQDTGKYICHPCASKEYKQRPNSTYNIIKQMRDCRIGHIDPNSPQGKGFLFEELTCRWRGVKNLNILNDNFTTGTPIDHSIDHELGIIQTRGRFISMISDDHYGWNFSNFKRDNNKEFDNMILYCATKDGIDRIYIIPKKELELISGINIYKKTLRTPWYEQYRIIYEKIIKTVDNIWNKILGEKYITFNGDRVQHDLF